MIATASSGDLLRVAVHTVCWRGDREDHVQMGDLVLLCSDERFVCVPGIEGLDVIHPKLGRVWCLETDLKKLEQPMISC